MKEFENLGSLNINSTIYKTRLNRRYVSRKPYKSADKRLILSFIPGTVLDILVKEGQKVRTGDELMILEAMKMQNEIKSPKKGVLKKIAVAEGATVNAGDVLAIVE